MRLQLMPWDNGEKPYWINPENGLEWYVDKKCSRWCVQETINGDPKLDAVVFIVAARVEGELKAQSRIIIDKKTNKVLADETSLESLAATIDVLRVALAFSEKEGKPQ